MEPRTLDLAAYPRRAHFDYFRQMANPYVSVTAPCDITALRADGGASVSDILMQMQADLLRIPVDRPAMVETTAFGAASLAGLACGLWRDTEELAALRRSQRVFLPQGTQADCDRNYRLWKRAVSRAADWIEH